MDLFKLVGSIFIDNDDANSKIDATTGKAESFASGLGSSMKSAGQSITNAGKAFAPMSIMATGALTACVKSGSDFTNGMAKMSTLFDTTKYSVSDLSNQFIDLSNKTGLSATELSEAGYQALSAGQNVEDVGKFVETAGNLAKAGFTSTSTAVDVLTTAMNAYGEQAGTAEEISNKLVRTQNLGKTTVDELASSMGKIIPTASAMNVDINNLTSGYVSLTKQGIATAEATTYMNGMLNELGKSTTTVGKALQEETGKSFQDLMAEGKSLGDVLQILQDHADKTGVGFNELWGSSEAGKAGLAILNGGVQEFNDTVSIMKSNTDDVGEALEKLNTPSVQAQKALNQIKNSATELGQVILTSIAPAFTKVCDAISKATQWFSNLDDGTKQTIVTIMGIIAVISPVLIIVGKVVGAIGTIITVVQTLIPIIGALNAVMMANPVAIVIVAIGALIAVFVYLWNHCEGFRNFWIGLWEKIKSITSTAVEGIKKFFSGIIDFVKNNWQALLLMLVNPFAGAFKLLYDNCEGFRNFIDGFIEKVKSIFSKVVDFFKNNWQGILMFLVNPFAGAFKLLYDNCEGFRNFINKILDGIKDAISTAWETIKNVIQVAGMFIVSLIEAWFDLITLPFRFIWENCKDIIMEVWNAIHDWVSAKIQAITDFFKNAFNAIKDFFTTIWEGIKTVFTTVWDAIYNFVSQKIEAIKSVVQTVMDAIKTVITTVMEAIKNVFTTVWNAIKTLVTTVINAIKTVIETAWNAIKTTVTTVMNAIKTVVTTVWNTIKTTVTSVIDAIKNSISTGLNSAKSTVTSVLNAIKSAFTSVWDGCKSIVSGAIDKIKSMMHFEWSLPHLKLPHFSISGKFSLDPPSVPSFGIEWYKNGGILNDATIFGMNPFNGKAMVGGEAGAEAIAPLDTLLGYIRTAVAEQNASLIQSLKESIHDLGDAIGNGSVGDVVVPVYLGNNLIDELVVDSRKRVLVRSGGMTNV